MRRNSITRYTALLCLLLTLATVGGAFGAWIYATDPPEPKDEDVPLTLNVFVWAPEEILPTVTPGENYLVLLDSIMENSKGGLNSSKDVLHKAVMTNGAVHSSQNVQGGNLKHLFTTEESKLLSFVTQKVTTTEIHVYMYEDSAVDLGITDVTRVPVYKTIIVEENGTWKAQQSIFGYATVRYMTAFSTKAIDPEEWIPDYETA